MGNSERDIKKLCPTAKVLSGLAIKAVLSAGQTMISELAESTWIAKVNQKDDESGREKVAGGLL